MQNRNIDITDLTLSPDHKLVLGKGAWLQVAKKDNSEHFIVKFVDNAPIGRLRLSGQARIGDFRFIKLCDNIHVLLTSSFNDKIFIVNMLNLQMTTFIPQKYYNPKPFREFFATSGGEVLLRNDGSIGQPAYNVYDVSDLSISPRYKGCYAVVGDVDGFYRHESDYIANMGDRFFSTSARSNEITEFKLENNQLRYVKSHKIGPDLRPISLQSPDPFIVIDDRVASLEFPSPVGIYKIIVIDDYLVSIHYKRDGFNAFDSIKIHKAHLDRLELFEDISGDKIFEAAVKYNQCLNPYVSEDGTIYLTEDVGVIFDILNKNWKEKQAAILSSLNELRDDSGQSCFPPGVNNLVLSYLFAPSSFSSGGNAAGVASTALSPSASIDATGVASTATAASASTGVASTAFAASAPSMVTTAPTAKIETQKSNKRQYSAI
jgi:hypothetical protein